MDHLRPVFDNEWIIAPLVFMFLGIIAIGVGGHQQALGFNRLGSWLIRLGVAAVLFGTFVMRAIP